MSTEVEEGGVTSQESTAPSTPASATGGSLEDLERQKELLQEQLMATDESR